MSKTASTIIGRSVWETSIPKDVLDRASRGQQRKYSHNDGWWRDAKTNPALSAPTRRREAARKQSELDLYKRNFVEQEVANGVSQEDAEHAWHLHHERTDTGLANWASTRGRWMSAERTLEPAAQEMARHESRLSPTMSLIDQVLRG